MYSNFRNDPYYLLKYYLINIGLLGAAILGLLRFSHQGTSFPHPFWWAAGLILFVLPNYYVVLLSGAYYFILFAYVSSSAFAPWQLTLVVTASILGIVGAAIIHNAAHGSLRPPWANRFFGELCGLHQLSGFAGWKITHMIHHAYPDDPERDPHPPLHLTYWQFCNMMGFTMKRAMTNAYFGTQGRTPKTERIWKTVEMLLPVVRLLRAYLMLLLFGPMGFTLFYIPSKISNAFLFAHFNYRTHRPRADGTFEILNISEGWSYRFLNLTTFGAYYHKNHHLRPRLFDPSRLKLADRATAVAP